MTVLQRVYHSFTGSEGFFNSKRLQVSLCQPGARGAGRYSQRTQALLWRAHRSLTLCTSLHLTVPQPVTQSGFCWGTLCVCVCVCMCTRTCIIHIPVISMYIHTWHKKGLPLPPAAIRGHLNTWSYDVTCCRLHIDARWREITSWLHLVSLYWQIPQHQAVFREPCQGMRNLSEFPLIIHAQTE